MKVLKVCGIMYNPFNWKIVRDTYFCHSSTRIKQDAMNCVIYGIQWNPNHRGKRNQQSHYFSPFWICVFSRFSILDWFIWVDVVEEYSLNTRIRPILRLVTMTLNSIDMQYQCRIIQKLTAMTRGAKMAQQRYQKMFGFVPIMLSIFRANLLTP